MCTKQITSILIPTVFMLLLLTHIFSASAEHSDAKLKDTYVLRIYCDGGLAAVGKLDNGRLSLYPPQPQCGSYYIDPHMLQGFIVELLHSSPQELKRYGCVASKDGITCEFRLKNVEIKLILSKVTNEVVKPELVEVICLLVVVGAVYSLLVMERLRVF